MTRNLAANMRIRTRGYRKFLLFKCQLPTCCNFITSFTSGYNRKYCFNHQDRYRLLPEFEHLLKS